MTKLIMFDYLDHLYVVILCGGTGTRVWPLSINKKPKQFLNFFEDKTLFQGALFRATNIVSPDKVILITNEKYVEEIKKESPQIPQQNIIAETEKKNTAMAMGVATAFISQKDPDAVVINLYSDHVVKNTALFVKTMKAATKVAFEKKQIVTVGLEPTYPHTGFGYIKVDGQIDSQDDLPVSRVDSFKEKPDLTTAKQYLASGKYLWNGGFYVWRSDIFEQEIAKHSPDIARNIVNLKKAFGTDKETQVLAQEYAQVRDESIDYALAEKTDKLLVIPGRFDWNDVGSWEVVYDLGKKDSNQNVAVHNLEAKNNPPLELHEVSGSLVYYTDNPIALFGVKDLVVVDTGNGILVCDRKRSNDVKKIVDSLKAKKLDQYL